MFGVLSMDSTPSISIIVSTRNRASPLSKMLHALSVLEMPSQDVAEIVVVDNASTDDTRAVVSDFARNSRIAICYVYERRPGLSVARNRGIAAARGNLLLFIDDDCLPAPTWMKSVVRAIGSDLRQVLGGRVELHDPRDAPVTIKTSLTEETLASHRGLNGFLHGCNMAIGRQVFDEIGRFDIRLGAGTSLDSAEDIDLVYRAVKAGIR